MLKEQNNWVSKVSDPEYLNSLSHPRFLELDGLIVLESHYTPESFQKWKKILESCRNPADFQKMENTINHVHLDDLSNDESLQRELGDYLQKIWYETLRAQFPEYIFECKVKHYEEGWELVMWKRR